MNSARIRPANAGSPSRRGLSLPEILISLAITSSLLTAVGAAFHSASSVVENNDKFFRATQSARVALNQMLTEVRRCDAINDARISATLLPILRPAETRPANEAMRFYKYIPATQKLVLYFEYVDGTLSPEYPIAHSVQSAPFSWDTGPDSNNHTAVLRVSAAIDVKLGKDQIRLSGSAAPRRAITYK
jgi:prepilin-type N-terminal cleavage/methylation domain-containing protein